MDRGDWCDVCGVRWCGVESFVVWFIVITSSYAQLAGGPPSRAACGEPSESARTPAVTRVAYGTIGIRDRLYPTIFYIKDVDVRAKALYAARRVCGAIATLANLTVLRQSHSSTR